ncbi:hypothetical protein ACHAWC_001637, partial [Mediolabrus comicus]
TASGTIGIAFNATTTIDNVDHFIVPAGVTVNMLGKIIVRANRITIDGTLDGTGGGYPGGASEVTPDYGYAPFGSSPPDSNGEGGGGTDGATGITGGGGGGHGGAGGRGGEQSYSATKTSYCGDNAHSGRFGGRYCVGSSAGYSGCCNTGGSPGGAYDNDDDDVSLLMYLPGSGGGAGAGEPGRAGGNGGASIVLYSNEMTLNGVIKANGGNGGNGNGRLNSAGGGGGSGGAI